MPWINVIHIVANMVLTFVSLMAIFSQKRGQKIYHRTEPYQEKFSYNGMKLMDMMLDTYTFRAVPWLLFIRRGYIEKTGITFYTGIIHEDELYSVLLYVQADKIGCLKHRFVKHRVRATSTSVRDKKES